MRSLAAAIVVLTLVFAAQGMVLTQKARRQEAPQKINSPPELSRETEWDPISCWDCPTPYEPEAMFFTGLGFAAPISLWVIRRRTRRLESVSTKRSLE